ncbi:MAG: hypothetical protein WAP47_03460 [Candidatus Rokuibacteriota bacterium]
MKGSEGSGCFRTGGGAIGARTAEDMSRSVGKPIAAGSHGLIT